MIMKINTLNTDASATLENNLKQLSIKFFKAGTAFVFDSVSYLDNLIFSGLWGGYESNIEDQSNSISNDDLEGLRHAGQ